MGDLMESSTPQLPPPRRLPLREECWTEEASFTLLDTWGRRYLELNRGHLRQKDWQEVADAVNARHSHSQKTHRTGPQCKNRMDTIKKKYRIENAKVTKSNGTLTSSWPFFPFLEQLIGSNSNKEQNKLALSASLSQSSHSMPPLSLPQKRPMLSEAVDQLHFRWNYSMMAAAAAAPELEEDVEEGDGKSVGEEAEKSKNRVVEEEGEGKDGMRSLTRVIERFANIYEKVEKMKLEQMMELENKRMGLAKELESQRRQFIWDTLFQLQKK